MYNDELKKDFIDSVINSKSRKDVALMCFAATQRYEENLDADLCTFSKDELREVLSQIIGVRSSGEVTRLSVLRLYAQWCKEKQYPGASDALLNVTPDTSERFASQYVKDPDDLRLILNTVFGSDDDRSIDCVYKGFFWLAFIGVPEEYSVKITIDDVDLTNHVVVFNDGDVIREYRIYKEALPVMRNLVMLDAFEVVHPLYATNIKHKPRFCSNQLLRGLNSNKTIRDLRRISFDKMNASGSFIVKSRSITYSRVLMSGEFYRMWCIERSTKGCNAADVSFKEYIRRLPGNEEISQKLLSHKDRFMRKDYEKWKQVYTI